MKHYNLLQMRKIRAKYFLLSRRTGNSFVRKMFNEYNAAIKEVTQHHEQHTTERRSRGFSDISKG